MIKITPVKQQTGARFYPGDISRTGAFGAEGRAGERLGSAIQSAIKVMGSIFDDNNRLEKVANREYVKGAIKEQLQDSFKYAYQNQNADGSNLVELFDRRVQDSNILEEYTKDLDDTEKKLVSGKILQSIGAFRLNLTKHSIQAGMQTAESNITRAINTKAGEITDGFSAKEYFDYAQETENSVQTKFYKNSFQKIRPAVAQKGIQSLIYNTLDNIVDEAHKSREMPSYQVFDAVEVYTRERLQEKDLSEKEKKVFKEFLAEEPPDAANREVRAWNKYLEWRVLENKGVGWADLQELAGMKEVTSLGVTSKGGSVAEALRNYIHDTRRKLSAELIAQEKYREAKEADNIKKVHLKHESLVVDALVLGNTTKAKKLVGLFNKGYTSDDLSDDKLKNVLTKTPSELKAQFNTPLNGDPLISPQWTKAVAANWTSYNKENAGRIVAKAFGTYVKDPTKKKMDEFTKALGAQAATLPPSTTKSYFTWYAAQQRRDLTPQQRTMLSIAARGVFDNLYGRLTDREKTPEQLGIALKAVNSSMEALVQGWESTSTPSPQPTKKGKSGTKQKPPGEQAKEAQSDVQAAITNSMYTDNVKNNYAKNINEAYDTIWSSLSAHNQSMLMRDGGTTVIPYPQNFAPLNRMLAYSVNDIRQLSMPELMGLQNEMRTLGNDVHNAVTRKQRWFKSLGASGPKTKITLVRKAKIFRKQMYKLADFYGGVHKGVTVTPKKNMVDQWRRK